MNIRALGFLLAVMSLAVNVLRLALPALYGDVSDVGPYTTLLMSPGLLAASILMMAIGGMAVIFGTGEPIGTAVTSPPRRGNRTTAQPLLLTAEAQTAAISLNERLTRFRSLPADTVSAEASIEFDAIVAKHLPHLRAAHDGARLTVPDGSTEAEALDHDYAQSLDRLTATVDRLVNDCSGAARDRFAVEQRFIEMRHPDGSLSI